jgi:hypothetical protein
VRDPIKPGTLYLKLPNGERVTMPDRTVSTAKDRVIIVSATMPQGDRDRLTSEGWHVIVRPRRTPNR